MSLSVTKPDGTPLGVLSFTATRGAASAHQAVLVKNLGVAAVTGLLAHMYAEKTPGSGTYATQGNPVVDELQGRMQITGIDSSATPGQTFVPGQTQVLGYLADGVLPSILPGDSVTLDLWIEQNSASAGGGAVNVKFEFAGNSAAVPLPPGVSVGGRGINDGKNQPRSFLISGRAATPTGTPDNQVHVALGAWLFAGVEYSDVAEALTFNQNDSAVVALGVGEAYGAVISQGATLVPTITKGVKAAAGAIIYPAPPSGELILAYVKVLYGAGGTVISGAELTNTTLVYGRFLGVAAAGLNFDVHPGEAFLADFRQIHGQKDTVVLVNAAVNRVWLTPAGALVVTQTAVQPVAGALLLWTVTTAGGAITVVTDNRVYVGSAGALALHAATHATGGTDQLTPGAIGAAPIASPALTGVPTAPTASAGTNTTQLATTAFVTAAVGVAVVAWKTPIVFAGNSVAQPAPIGDKPVTENLFVYIDGDLQRDGDLYTYNAATGQVTFTPVLATGKTAVLRYVQRATGGGARITEKSSTAPDGVRRDFAFTFNITDLAFIAIDGQIQDPADYGFATNVVTFVAGVTPPDAAAKIVAEYFH
ncbi:MAG: hypothetical protein M3167_06280 [Acidobacteriota bacterium]|nr:hypothetical protein [Acidobacteriota bacterium]MDQ6892271.1 hypothetical protein [Acidobacteriota bacterium]